MLARIPLSVALRFGGDAGAPVVLVASGRPGAAAILALAERSRDPRRAASPGTIAVQVNG